MLAFLTLVISRYGDVKGPKIGAHVQLENFGALRYA